MKGKERERVILYTLISQPNSATGSAVIPPYCSSILEEGWEWREREGKRESCVADSERDDGNEREKEERERSERETGRVREGGQ